MSKRRSENGQMRREEFEALENVNDASGCDETNQGTFKRASSSQVSKRRIVLARGSRAPKGKSTFIKAPSSSSTTSSSFSAAATNPSTATSATTPFSGFSFASAASPLPPTLPKPVNPSLVSTTATPFSGFTFNTPAPSTAAASPVEVTPVVPVVPVVPVPVSGFSFKTSILPPRVAVQAQKDKDAPLKPTSDTTSVSCHTLNHPKTIKTISTLDYSSPVVGSATAKTTTVASVESTATQLKELNLAFMEWIKDQMETKQNTSSLFSSAVSEYTRYAKYICNTSVSSAAGGAIPTSTSTPMTVTVSANEVPLAATTTTTPAVFSMFSSASSTIPATIPAAVPATDATRPITFMNTPSTSFSTVPAAVPVAQTPSVVAATGPRVVGAVIATCDEDAGFVEPPTVVAKTDYGDETVLYESLKVKLLMFNDNAWNTKGICSLTLLQNPSTGSVRLVMRNAIGKVFLNAAMLKHADITLKEHPKVMEVNLVVTEKGAPTKICLRVNMTVGPVLYQALLEAQKTLL